MLGGGFFSSATREKLQATLVASQTQVEDYKRQLLGLAKAKPRATKVRVKRPAPAAVPAAPAAVPAAPADPRKRRRVRPAEPAVHPEIKEKVARCQLLPFLFRVGGFPYLK